MVLRRLAIFHVIPLWWQPMLLLASNSRARMQHVLTWELLLNSGEKNLRAVGYRERVLLGMD